MRLPREVFIPVLRGFRHIFLFFSVFSVSAGYLAGAMRNFVFAAAAAALLLLSSCEMLPFAKAEGEIVLSFAEDVYVRTKAAQELPDTNDFLLRITGPDGKVLYEGLYGAAPERIPVAPGSCLVEAYSCAFSEPAFSAPQWGDSQVVLVQPGETARVRLLCSQQNCGMQLRVRADFAARYADASLVLRSDEGALTYGYDETRIAYFLPGNVSLLLRRGADAEPLLVRNLARREVLVLTLSASVPEGAGALCLQVDTSRVWTHEEYVAGEAEGEQGSSAETALSVPEARAASGGGLPGVWVAGYIVGGDLTSSGASFEAPFTSKTNLLLAAKASVRDRAACLSVQLPKGALRDALNLHDHPDLLGRRLIICGDLVPAYYSLPGLKNPTDYRLP